MLDMFSLEKMIGAQLPKNIGIFFCFELSNTALIVIWRRCSCVDNKALALDQFLIKGSFYL
jgi:hypothetical protein